jgi:DNA polymerase-1
MTVTFILDASSFQHRAFHVTKARPMYTKTGVPIAGVSLFRKMLVKVQRDCKPDNLIAAMDAETPTWRHKLYPQYKANRTAPDPEYIQQIPGFRQVLLTAGIPTFEAPGWEADDVIGTLTKKVQGDIVIVSGDKDMAQLVDDRVLLLQLDKKHILDEFDVTLLYGVPPSQIVDYLALVGDATDNVPGCKGIGSKGAVQLLNEFGTVEAIIENRSSIASNLYRHAVTEHMDDLLLSKKLVTICRDIPTESLHTLLLQ